MVLKTLPGQTTLFEHFKRYPAKGELEASLEYTYKRDRSNENTLTNEWIYDWLKEAYMGVGRKKYTKKAVDIKNLLMIIVLYCENALFRT